MHINRVPAQSINGYDENFVALPDIVEQGTKTGALARERGAAHARVKKLFVAISAQCRTLRLDRLISGAATIVINSAHVTPHLDHFIEKYYEPSS